MKSTKAGNHPFFAPTTHGFVRVSVCVPKLRVADPSFNLAATLELAARAERDGAALAVFPELGLSAYSNEDLFQQDALLGATLDALSHLVEQSASRSTMLVVGAPLRLNQQLYNCAIVVHGGRILGISPKSYLPNYREFYEKRQFSSGREAGFTEVTLFGKSVPFGNDLVFRPHPPDRNDPGAARHAEDFTFHIEICEDLWAPIPPSTFAALAGATVLVNLSASNITVGKSEYRRELASAQSGRCVAAYLYAAAGQGESTTDLAWDGDAMIYENARLLAEAARFSEEEQLITADIDVNALVQDRMRLTTFTDSIREHGARVREIRSVPFEFAPPPLESDQLRTLRRRIPRFPYVPSGSADRDTRCFEAYNIQVHGLAKRLAQSGIEKVVIGVSGGLDSTHAVIVAAKTMDLLGRPRKNVRAVTMPGFATSSSTLKNAHALMDSLGVEASEIDIRPSCMQMFRDLGHPFAQGQEVYDITFENVQAGERTSHLFRLANLHNALVVGTGDLSELALGWATYGVGDHMSHYNVNASVPKTLIQYLIRWVADTGQFNPDASAVLRDILDTEISPELVPGADRDSGPAQSTEQKIGPYELQDFHLYYTTRYGFRPSKVAFLSYCAWHDRAAGVWPDDLPAEKRHEYDLATIRKWLEVFLFRFFQISQFKRSCIPNAPKVGSGGSLSPRGDWRAPSDSEAKAWTEELRVNVPEA